MAEERGTWKIQVVGLTGYIVRVDDGVIEEYYPYHFKTLSSKEWKHARTIVNNLNTQGA